MAGCAAVQRVGRDLATEHQSQLITRRESIHREGHTFSFARSLVCVSPEKRGQAGSTEIGGVVIVEAWSPGSAFWYRENIRPS